MSDTMRDAFMAFLLEPAPELYDASNTDAAYIWQRAWQAAQSQPAPQETALGYTLSDVHEAYSRGKASQPAPPVPASVQEILHLLSPYVRACMNSVVMLPQSVEQCEAAFKPLEAALTALVSERDRLKFELDGVNAMRRFTEQQNISGWWNSVKDSGAWSGAIVGLEWAELWPEAQDMLKALVKATHGIEPEQGGNHG